MSAMITHVVYIAYPGAWLSIENEVDRRDFEALLSLLDTKAVEAGLSLTLFEHAQSPKERAKNDQLRQSIRSRVDADMQAEPGLIRRPLESDGRYLRMLLEAGVFPATYDRRLAFMHAHTFVYALNSFLKGLDEICEHQAAPPEVRSLRDNFVNDLPVLRKIRNSALHLEDRSRRYASSKDKRIGKRMDTGFLGLSNLEDDKLCYTIDDGSYQKISISAATLSVLAKTINAVVGSFKWTGLPHISPS